MSVIRILSRVAGVFLIVSIGAATARAEPELTLASIKHPVSAGRLPGPQFVIGANSSNCKVLCQTFADGGRLHHRHIKTAIHTRRQT